MEIFDVISLVVVVLFLAWCAWISTRVDRGLDRLIDIIEREQTHQHLEDHRRDELP